MRISDWSSDVCSSDLHPVVSALRHDLPARLAREDLLLRTRLRLPADPDRHLDAYRSAVHRPARLADAARRQAPPALFDRARRDRARRGAAAAEHFYRAEEHDPITGERRCGKEWVSTCR